MSKTLHINEEAVLLDSLTRRGGELSFNINGKSYTFRIGKRPDGTLLLEQEIADGVWQRTAASVWQSGKELKRVQLGALEAKVREQAVSGGGHSDASQLSPTAPMPGLVRQLLVKVGDTVKAGQPLAVMEAMKLQLTLSAGADAVVEALLVKEGDMVAEGTELVKLKV